MTVGNFTQTSDGVLEMEVSGTTPGTYDTLHVLGTASLGGIMRIVNQTPGLTIGSNIPLVTGNVGSTKFDNVETVGADGLFYFAPNYNSASATSYELGDMNRNGVRGMDDIPWFALALTDRTKYWNSNTQNEGGVPCICVFGAQSGNMDGVSGLDFDDIDDFADAINVDGASIIAEIRRLSNVPEPDSIALLSLGLLGAAAFAYRPERLATIHARSPAN
jgi:hypothetical protein